MLEKGNLVNLMQQNDELLVGALSDLLKTVILAFPYGAEIPAIFQMALILIETNLKDKHDLAIIKLFHFIMLEFNNNLGLNN